MKVKELIELLQSHDPELPIVFSQFSDYTELEAKDIYTQDLQARRGDGYVGSHRPDKQTVTYLCFPGN